MSRTERETQIAWQEAFLKARFRVHQKGRERVVHLVNLLYGDCGLESEVNQNNFSLAKERLRKGSLVVLTNHFTADDAITAFYATAYGLDKEIKTLTAITARKHHDFQRYPFNAFFLSQAFRIGAETMMLVQHSDLRSYSAEERRFLLRQSSAKTAAALSQPGGVLIVAPEATRSQNMALQPAQKLVDHLAKYDDEVSFLPLGIEPNEQAKRGFNFVGRRFKIRVGQPFTANELETNFRVLGLSDYPFRDQLMVKIGLLLPKKMWGHYHSQIEDYLEKSVLDEEKIATSV